MASAAILPSKMETTQDLNASDAQKAQAHFELGITLCLFLWPELSLAVSNQWGGPDSSSKREWFAQTTIDVLTETSDADAEWIESFLLQVMNDEFEVNVEDDSAYEVGEQIVEIRRQCGRGEFSGVLRLRERWEERGGREEVNGGFRDEGEVDAETDGSGDEGDGDMEMGEAPSVVRTPRERVVPEVDDDGFTKVARKR
ncbi:Pre-rRNA-processing protein TSR2-domain-containing protein [Calycina marina]|uniref:Pre-rRNA-processing protein TSR2-domain-containing protein n=1 Tax=Calycina marina TaxID=1763456 RepID=A0A9P7Z509_9HELO|nr:Pre-rRNA-processing protein TSR2-domain-containing protein [Calycina marina]